MFAGGKDYPDIIQTGGGDGYGMMGAWWIFALVIIFFALVFWGRKDEKRAGFEDLLGAAAIGQMNKHQEPPGYFADINGRFNDISRQIAHVEDANAWRKIDSDLYGLNQNVNQQAFNLSAQVQQTRFDQLVSMKDMEGKQALGFACVDRNIDSVKYADAENTQKIMARINDVEKRMDQSTIDRLRDELYKERLAAGQYRQDLLIERNGDRVIGALTRRGGLPPCPPGYPTGAAAYGYADPAFGC